MYLRVLFFLLAIYFSSGGFSQEANASTDFLCGKLSNGLSYFIKHDPKADKVLMNFIVKAGFGHEEKDQAELSHLLEHMAFVKTVHFDDPWNYFTGKGLKIADDINAFTTYTHTGYKLRIPLTDKELIQKGLLFFRDVADGIVLNKSNADKERNAVIEEIRPMEKSDSKERAQTDLFFNPNQNYYGYTVKDRMQKLKSYQYDQLVNFYKTWYRPDLQAVIIYGNVDMDNLELQIKNIFSDLEYPGNSLKDIKTKSKNTIVPGFARMTDTSVTSVVFKFRPIVAPVATSLSEFIRSSMVNELTSLIVENRLTELALKEINSSFNYSYYSSQNLVGVELRAKPVSLKEGFKKAAVEMERLVKYGVRAEELNAAKNMLLDKYGESFAEESFYMGKIIELFLHCEDTVTALQKNNLRTVFGTAIASLTPGDIKNKLKNCLSLKDNRVLIVGPVPDTMQLPDDSTLTQWIRKVKNDKIDPYIPVPSKEILTLAEIKKLQPKKITNLEHFEKINVTKISFDNGITVLFKPMTTINSEKQIYFRALDLAKINKNHARDELILNVAIATQSQSGWGHLNPQDIEVFRQKHSIEFNPGISRDRKKVWLTAQCHSKDLEQMLQIFYQSFVKPYFDNETFKRVIERIKKSNRNDTDAKSPENEFNAPLFPLTHNDITQLDSISLKAVKEAYRNYFANPARFSLVVTGNFTEKELLPLLQKYIGNIPASMKKNITEEDSSIRKNENFTLQLSERKNKNIYGVNNSIAFGKLRLVGKYNYNTNHELELAVINVALNSLILHRLRAVEGIVYNLGVQLSQYESSLYCFDIQFSCDPGSIDKGIESVRDEINKMINTGVSAQTYEMIRAQLKDDYFNKIQKPNFWAIYLCDQIANKKVLAGIINEREQINGLTWEKINQVFRQYLINANMSVITLRP